MRQAHQLGLDVPDWLVTNDPESALAFAERHEGPAAGVVIKTLHAGRVDVRRTLYTTRLVDPELLRNLGPEPYLLQAFIDKQFDVRVVIIGTEVYATAIASQVDSRSEVDVRAGDIRALSHRRFALPGETAERLVHLIQDLGLEFATADLVVDHDNRPWFLEINPNGQWGWLQELTGAPLAERLVQRLSG